VLSIGEFSRVTRITVKALRLYHEKGILVPDAVGDSSGYRYYGSGAVERAETVKRLKEMGFSLDEIRDILEACKDDGEIVARVERKLEDVEKSLRQYGEMKKTLALFLQSAEARRLKVVPGVALEDLPDILICGLRFRGKYEDVGHKIGPLFRACARQAAGRPFSLYYDGEFKEEDADIEICVAVKRKVAAAGIDCRSLPGGRAATIIHRGPYPTVGRSYQTLFEFCAEKELKTLLPIREEYVKGPGFIFRGNPKNYLTKLTVLLELK
jgi:DNA-binding transcriptional MerR regulator